MKVKTPNPCPFGCHSKPKVMSNFVMCANVHCETSGPMRSTTDLAIDAWNKLAKNEIGDPKFIQISSLYNPIEKKIELGALDENGDVWFFYEDVWRIAIMDRNK